MDERLLKSIEIPQYYLEFIKRYVELGLYPSYNAFITKSLEDQIRKEETLLSDLNISKIFTEIDSLRNRCSICTDRNGCQDCIQKINEQISLKITQIGDLKQFIEKKRKEQQQASRSHIRNINLAMRQMQHIKGS